MTRFNLFKPTSTTELLGISFVWGRIYRSWVAEWPLTGRIYKSSVREGVDLKCTWITHNNNNRLRFNEKLCNNVLSIFLSVCEIYMFYNNLKWPPPPISQSQMIGPIVEKGHALPSGWSIQHFVFLHQRLYTQFKTQNWIWVLPQVTQ